MKRILIVLMLLGAISSEAQNKSTGVKKPVTKSSPAKSQSTMFKNLNDSASYAIGLSVANFYTQQGLKNINTAIVAKAINDAVSGKGIVFSEAVANEVMMRCMNEAQAEKAKQNSQKAFPTIKAGETFLAQNKTKPGVKTTPSGLQYQVITEGAGIKPTESDTVVAHYAGTLIDGTEFDNSFKRGQPITITPTNVIKGWTEALQLMGVGSKYKLFIPYQLGYGLNDMGTIPPGSVLIFEVELLDVKKAH